MTTKERPWSASSTTSSLSSVADEELQLQVDEAGRWSRWEAIIPGVILRQCQPGSDWTSARVRRVHRFLLITLPSLPMLVAALASAIYLQHRYDGLINTGHF